MNPRSAWQFLTSKFGLFLVFLAVLFVGLWIFGRQQASAHENNRVATSTKSPEVGQVRIALEKGLEDGLPQQVALPPAQAGASTHGQLVPFKQGTYVAPPPPVTAKRLASPGHFTIDSQTGCPARWNRRSGVRSALL